MGRFGGFRQNLYTLPPTSIACVGAYLEEILCQVPGGVFYGGHPLVFKGSQKECRCHGKWISMRHFSGAENSWRATVNHLQQLRQQGIRSNQAGVLGASWSGPGHGQDYQLV